MEVLSSRLQGWRKGGSQGPSGVRAIGGLTLSESFDRLAVELDPGRRRVPRQVLVFDAIYGLRAQIHVRPFQELGSALHTCQFRSLVRNGFLLVVGKEIEVGMPEPVFLDSRAPEVVVKRI